MILWCHISAITSGAGRIPRMPWQGRGASSPAQRDRESVFPPARPHSADSGECAGALAASAGQRRRPPVGGGECYNPRMKARRSSSGKGALRERRRQARLSRVALLATGEKERERRIEVAAAKSATARVGGIASESVASGTGGKVSLGGGRGQGWRHSGVHCLRRRHDIERRRAWRA